MAIELGLIVIVIEQELFMLEQMMGCYMHLMQKLVRRDGLLFHHLLQVNYQQLLMIV